MILIEFFSLMGYKFEIIDQSNNSKFKKYQIRITNKDDETYWLKEPQSEYKTLSGCYQAILFYSELVSEMEGYN